MNRFLFALVLVSFFSCSNDPSAYIQHIEGYWEIEAVTTSDGLKKEYTFSDTIDFIQFTDSLNGIRRKMKPNLLGNFESSLSVESFELKIENDSLNVYYKTPYAEWKETILGASETNLVVVNANNVTYLYKRYEPLELDLE